MEIDSPDTCSGSIIGTQKENGVHLSPVSVGDCGEGLPYAPINWPNPGDNWCWRVGARITPSGHFRDRYLYPPKHLWGSCCKKGRLVTKHSVEKFIRSNVPSADVDAFFASFSWKIPAKQLRQSEMPDDKEDNPPSRETPGTLVSDSPIGDLACTAGNRLCNSLKTGSSSLAMFCDICCSEPGFCRDCCCILCCKTISLADGGYSYIRCEALVEGNTCGHIAHINCGLRSYLAGTVGGTIGLDAEYYCRRCDSRSDLVSHVRNLLKTCESLDSREDIEMILNVGKSMLRGSERASAEELLHLISSVIVKLRDGADLEDVWKKEDKSEVRAEGLYHIENGALELKKYEDPPEERIFSPLLLSSKFDHRVETVLLEDEIDHILLALKKSQEYEYKLAQETLSAQKNSIKNLYQQLDGKRSELSQHASPADANDLRDAFASRVDHIKQELKKLEDMKEVAKGFGRTPKHILKEHFNLETEY